MKKKILPLKQLAVLCLLFSFAVSSCKKDKAGDETVAPTTNADVSTYDNRVVYQWQDLFLKIERYAAVYRPCPAARMLAYMGLGAYESCVPGMPDYKSIAYLYPGLHIPAQEANAEYNYGIVLNSEYANFYRHFYANVQASDKAKIDSLEAALNSSLTTTVSQEVSDRSKAYGNAVADAIWNYSGTDAYGHDQYLNPRPTNYIPPVGSGLWVPTPPGNQAGMFPYWGGVRTFAISGAEKLCNPPIAYSTSPISPFYAQALEVYSLTTPQTADAKWCAEFWSDDVLGFTFGPPSRWLGIENQVLEQTHANLETAIMASVKLGLALNDAAVGCWNSKYHYNVLRPVTYIQNVMGYTSWNIAPLTSTQFITSTPSFPAYPSGHATFGAASAEALSSVFGYNFHFTDRCHQTRTDFNGSPRSFNSFYDAAVENALSRIYLGVHYRMDADEGVRYGSEIGRKVNALPFRK